MSLNQYDWPRRKKCRNLKFLAQTTLVLKNRLSEKVYLEENEIGQYFFVEEIYKTHEIIYICKVKSQ